jgi:hypothetical protein
MVNQSRSASSEGAGAPASSCTWALSTACQLASTPVSLSSLSSKASSPVRTRSRASPRSFSTVVSEVMRRTPRNCTVGEVGYGQWGEAAWRGGVAVWRGKRARAGESGQVLWVRALAARWEDR